MQSRLFLEMLQATVLQYVIDHLHEFQNTL